MKVFIVIAVVGVFLLLAWVRIRRWRSAGSESARMQSIAELKSELERLEKDRVEAEKRGDAEMEKELMLQIRVKEHWINKIENPDESWKAYYKKTSGKILDEWGKSGAK